MLIHVLVLELWFAGRRILTSATKDNKMHSVLYIYFKRSHSNTQPYQHQTERSISYAVWRKVFCSNSSLGVLPFQTKSHAFHTLYNSNLHRIVRHFSLFASNSGRISTPNMLWHLHVTFSLRFCSLVPYKVVSALNPVSLITHQAMNLPPRMKTL